LFEEADMRVLGIACVTLALAGAAATRGQAQATGQQAAKVATAGGTLGALAADITAGRLAVIDLTQLLNASTPIIQLPPPFANTPGFKSHAISAYDEKGPAWYWNWIEVGEHVGTHFDAPCHWVTGKGKPCVDQLEARQFIGPAVVIDVTADVAKSADFVATRDTILAWENAHGRVPAGSWIILRTGWGSRATDAARFMNVGADGAPHYPGFGKDSAEFLTGERDVLGVGVEQVGTDAAVGAKADPPFPNHSIMHGAGKFGLTQLANVDKLPESGAMVIATPLKIEHGSGSPVRVIALAPAAR
jgi:kynurenine formamidase